MKSGLLWYNANPATGLDSKINQAAQRYFEKFGIKPNRAFVNPHDLREFALGRDPLTYKMPCAVASIPTIMSNYIMVGVEPEIRVEPAVPSHIQIRYGPGDDPDIDIDAAERAYRDAEDLAFELAHDDQAISESANA